MSRVPSSSPRATGASRVRGSIARSSIARLAGSRSPSCRCRRCCRVTHSLLCHQPRPRRGQPYHCAVVATGRGGDHLHRTTGTRGPPGRCSGTLPSSTGPRGCVLVGGRERARAASSVSGRRRRTVRAPPGGFLVPGDASDASDAGETGTLAHRRRHCRQGRVRQSARFIREDVRSTRR
jgi:hypothetical protein